MPKDASLRKAAHERYSPSEATRLIESSAGTRSLILKGRRVCETAVASLSVRVTEGPDSGISASLASTSLRVGTAPDNDLVLTDTAVSRRHVVLVRATDGVQVEDCGSKNGTWHEGVKLGTATVPDGATLRVGSTLLRVRCTSEKFVVVPEDNPSFHGLVSRSPRMLEIFALVRQLAKVEVPVNVTGETGTGKELIARALHDAGPRRKGPYQVLDCGSILPELLRAEMFGHERGAFTGADAQRKGVFEMSSGGTVLLDEVGEIDLAVQPNLLRVLDGREIQRLGSTHRIPIDCRIVSATNRDLSQMVQQGRFRQDLLYRLSGVTLRLPPLRERTEDIPLLVDHFLASASKRQGIATQRMSQAAMALLKQHAWPGNVRELRHVIDVSAALTAGSTIEERQVRESFLPAPSSPQPTAHGPSLMAAEKAAILQALETTDWNRLKASRMLGIARSTLYLKMQELGIKRPGDE